ncbi:MAG: radical SAM-associated putative lipoprotein [Bacteroidales bacterium]|nr:radical SAM-associated putative lipoprotein [Bacteroidales bacterium]
MKQKLNKWWTRILVMILAFLGYACGDSEKEEEEEDIYIYGPDLYGCPSASYKIIGTVMDQDSLPIAGAQVRVNWDAVKTDSTGTYSCEGSNGGDYEVCIVTECDGYEKDSVTYVLDFKGGNHWYAGHCDTTYNPILHKIPENQ